MELSSQFQFSYTSFRERNLAERCVEEVRSPECSSVASSRELLQVLPPEREQQLSELKQLRKLLMEQLDLKVGEQRQKVLYLLQLVLPEREIPLERRKTEGARGTR